MFKFVQIFRSNVKQNFVRFSKNYCCQRNRLFIRIRKNFENIFCRVFINNFFFLQHIWKRIRSSINGGKFFFFSLKNMNYEPYKSVGGSVTSGCQLDSRLSLSPTKGGGGGRLFPRMEIRAIKYHRETARRALLSFWGHCRRPQ